MSILKKLNKKIFTRTKIQFLITFVIMSVVISHGYAIDEDYIDNKKIEIGTYAHNQSTGIAKSSTTTIPILLYHKVSNKDAVSLAGKRSYRRLYSVQTDVFEAQMKYVVDEGYTPLTVKALIKAEMSGTLPEKPIAVTFDDGWKSQYENALPVLQKYNIPATFYIISRDVGIPLYMTWDDLHTLVNLHMEIGDHTMNHPHLTKINPKKLNEELVQSRDELENTLHLTVSDFAYPYGDYNAVVTNAVKEAGYTSGRTSNYGIYNDFKDIYHLNVIAAPTDLQTLQNLLRRQ